MKRNRSYLTTVTLLFLISCTVAFGQQPREPKWTYVIIQKVVAETIWDKGVSNNPETLKAMRTGLRERRSPEEATKILAGLDCNKSCHEFCGDAPLFECMHRCELVALELPENVAIEWLAVLTSNPPTHLSENAANAIKFAFCRALTPNSQHCFLG